MRAWLFCLLFVVPLAAHSQPQPVPNTPQVQTNQKADSPTKSKEYSDQAKPDSDKPASTQPIPTAKSANSHGSGDSKNTTEYWSILSYKGRVTDWLLAFFTLALVIIGTAQGIFLLGTLRATDRAATAATDAASIIPTIERPFVFAWITLAGDMIASSNHKAKVQFENHGRTPAIVRTVLAVIELATTYPRRRERLLPVMVGIEAVVPVLGDNPSAPGFSYLMQFEMSSENIANIRAGRTKLLCVGIIEYKDVFGAAHETGWCWEYEFAEDGTSGFRVSQNKELNYRT